jgi:hypothetical protein
MQIQTIYKPAEALSPRQIGTLNNISDLPDLDQYKVWFNLESTVKPQFNQLVKWNLQPNKNKLIKIKATKNKITLIHLIK